MNIIRRAEWGARHDDGHGAANVPWAENWLHHSVTIAPDLVPPYDDEHAAMRTLEQIGEDRFGRGISYTVAVMPSGRAYEGHALHKQGAHTAGRNSTGRAIVLVGNYDTDEPTAAQIETTAQILAGWWRRGLCPVPYLAGGHRDAPGAVTACPGRHGRTAVDRINQRAWQIADAEDQEGSIMARTLSEEDAELIAAKVWGHELGATKGGGVELPSQTAASRVNALHRLNVLQKKRHGDILAQLSALEPAELAEVIPENVVPEVVAELVRRLHNAPPPAARAEPESVPAAFVAADAAAGDLEDPADAAERAMLEAQAAAAPSWLPSYGTATA